jgi:HK97 gp10 family phage protein
MRISASTTGGEQLIRNLQKYGDERERKVQAVIDLTAQLVRTDAIKSMKSSPASGRTYIRRTVRHTASSSPNPPRIDTGRLANSVKALVGRLEAFVGTNVEYGPYLEFGTQDIKERPWLFPAFERQRRNFVNRLREAMR